MKQKVTIRKYMGDDKYSWAIFREGQLEPVVSGLSRQSAQYHRERVKKLTEEKES